MTDAERTAAHDAGHACACVMLGVPVRLIDVVGDTRYRGTVRHDLEQITTRGDARKRMLIILCGQIEGADDWEQVPSWPLNPHASTDEYNLDALADYLELDRKAYDDIATEALNLTLEPMYHTLHVAVTGMLGYVPRIDAALLEKLKEIARNRRCST